MAQHLVEFWTGYLTLSWEMREGDLVDPVFAWDPWILGGLDGGMSG